MNDHSNTTPEKEAVPSFEPWQVNFLKWLAKKGNISLACRKAKKGGIDRKWAYEKRKADPFFKEAWDDALAIATDALEEEARRRAEDGLLRPVYYEGKKVGSVREYSDTLMIFLLKAHNPQKFRENHHHKHVIEPVAVRHDFSKLTTEELRQLRALTAKMHGEEGDGDAGSADAL